MVNIISQNGYFFREVPFTTKNAEALRTNTKRGFAIYESGQYVRFLSTDILNVDFPIALIKKETTKPYKEYIKKCTPEGIDEDGMKVQLFVPTTFNTYENFRPTIYQPCLVRYEERWYIAFCNGYNDKGLPTFYDYETTYECLPFCKATEGLLNENQLSWKEFVAKKIERQEIKMPTDTFSKD